jgi:nicotinamidase-related amidase
VRHESPPEEGVFLAGTPGVEFKREALPRPGEPVITKHVNSAFIGTDLEERLRSSGVEVVALVGLTTDHCVSTTARMAANLGFDTWVVSDATAAFDRVGPDGIRYPAELVHAIALSDLHGEFARIVDTESVLSVIEPPPRHFWVRR